jgi:hypothetical protein
MFYVIISLAALVLLNGLYAVVCLLAGLWPMTAVALWIANSRNKTTGAGETPDDQSAADDAAMAPGIGAEDERPLGDTPEAHDEISPHDLPKGHPGRRAAERLAENREGATCGHAEGGAATSGLEFAAGAEQPETVTEEEAREGARIRP